MRLTFWMLNLLRKLALNGFVGEFESLEVSATKGISWWAVQDLNL